MGRGADKQLQEEITMSETPDNMERAIALLRRQRYHDVADFLEEEFE